MSSNEIKITVLGCGSALPTAKMFNSAYCVEMRQKQFLIDCGEATQIRFRQLKVKNNRLNNIFISHLHGDHCFGLVGLLSTMGLMGRTNDITIHSHPDLEKLLKPIIDYFCQNSLFNVIFKPFDPYKSQVIYEDRSVSVTTIPLKHRVPTCGFLFEEKPSKFAIKAPKKFAYCSDTIYREQIIEQIKDVDLLIHEATFLEDELKRAKETFHSTASQAATIALKANAKKLMLTHYSARYQTTEPFVKEAKAVFENSVAAYDGMVINV